MNDPTGNSQMNRLFLPEEMESIKLNNLRQKRRELEDKLKMVSNRINMRRKKQEEELRRFVHSEERSRVVSHTKNFKKINLMLKEQQIQKKMFEEKKKAKEVEDFRITNNRRLSLIYQSVKDRKCSESEKLRRAKKIDEQNLIISRQEAISGLKDKHEQVQKMKERQLTRRKCYWLQKRLTFQQNMIEETQIYEKQIEDYYHRINDLKQHEQELKEKQGHAAEVLKCAEQNYQLLRQS